VGKTKKRQNNIEVAMPDKDKNNDKSTKKKNESASATPATAPLEDSEGKEKHQLAGNDPTAVNEAAKRAEMAVSDAEREVARTIEAMKTQETDGRRLNWDKPGRFRNYGKTLTLNNLWKKQSTLNSHQNLRVFFDCPLPTIRLIE
jgi:hypothetical protein